MAELVTYDDRYVSPGDMVDLAFRIVGRNEVMIALAVHEMKQKIAHDERFDYQSGKRENRTDLETGTVYEYLVVRVIVRKTPKQERDQVQRASILVPLAVIVGCISAVAIAYAGVLAYDSYSVQRIALSDESDATKVAALGALETPLAARFAKGDWFPWMVGGGLLAGMLLVGRRIRS